MLNRAICQVNLSDYEEALKTLYQLNYEQPDDQGVQRALAWALTCDDKLEQAVRIFQQLEADEALTDQDNLNYGYCLWLQGHLTEGAAKLRRYYEKHEAGNDGYKLYQMDEDWLKHHGISDTEINMMEDLIGLGS